MEYQSNKILDDVSFSDEDSHGFFQKKNRKLLIVCTGWLWVLVMALLWSVEPWQRPWLTRVPDDRIWLGLSCLGLLGLILFPWRNSPARMIYRAALVLVLGGLLLGGLRVTCENLAVDELQSKLKADYPEIGGGLIEVREKVPMARKLADFLRWVGVGSPQWLNDHVSNLPQTLVPPAYQFIAQSRLPVRIQLAESMLRDPVYSDYMILYWKDLFPAITGQDVTLECRSKWIEQLDALRKEPGLPAHTQRASLLMMGLIVLTDPPEFGAWRVPVRDAMLSSSKPFKNLYTGESSILWYRTLDALLALDPPESWSALTLPLLLEEETCLQAMEVPLRGLTGDFDAFLAAFEKCQDKHDKLLLWQGAGFSLQAWPEIFDSATAERMHSWWRDTLFRWIMALGDGSEDDMSSRDAVLLDVVARHPAPLFSDDQQEQLTTASTGWIAKILTRPESHFHTTAQDLARMRHLLRHLSEERGDAMRKALIPLMLEPERCLTKNGKGTVSFDENWAALLWTVQPQMNDEQQRLLHDRLAPWIMRMAAHDRCHNTLLCIEAWSRYPILPPEIWLACAWSSGGPWREVPSDSPPDRRAEMPRNPFVIPEIPESTILNYILLMESAWRAGKGFKNYLTDQFPDIRFESRSRLTSAYGHILVGMRGLDVGGPGGSERLEAKLKADLAEAGLLRENETILDALKERAWRGNYDQPGFLRDPERSQVVWNMALQDPQVAATEVRRSIGGENENSALCSLIQTMEAHAPDDSVIRAAWNVLRAMSWEKEYRIEAYGALFRLAHRMPAQERLAMRRDYLADHVGYSLYENFHPDWNRRPPNPLHLPGGGIGIPWEEDALSACRSWRAALDRQFHEYPVVPSSTHHRELFAYLAHGSHADLHSPTRWYETPKVPPLTAPFPPSPWQKARELYRKRPDFRFPDH